MFEPILQQMKDAARWRRVYLTEHAREELDDDGLTFRDVLNCILTGEIIEQQFDAERNEDKYVLYGDCLNKDEMAVVCKLIYNHGVGVITVYRLRVTDYD